MSLREIIRAAVAADGGSQAAVARRAGITPARLCDYLAGRRDLTGESLDGLLAALDLAVGPGDEP